MSDTEPNPLAHRGRFTLASQVVNEAPEIAIKVMSGLLVTRCTHSFAQQQFRYEAIAPEHFEPIEDGEDLPNYDMAYDEDTGLTTWTRVP